MNEELKSRLLQMVEDESHLKIALASDGSLYEGYPKKINAMEEDVRENNLSPPKDFIKRQSEMNEFLNEVGWIP